MRLKTPNWRIPSLDSFIESIIREQDKLTQMGFVKDSKNQDLLARETKNAKEKGNQKGKEKKNTNFKRKEK